MSDEVVAVTCFDGMSARVAKIACRDDAGRARLRTSDSECIRILSNLNGSGVFSMCPRCKSEVANNIFESNIDVYASR